MVLVYEHKHDIIAAVTRNHSMKKQSLRSEVIKIDRWKACVWVNTRQKSLEIAQKSLRWSCQLEILKRQLWTSLWLHIHLTLHLCVLYFWKQQLVSFNYLWKNRSQMIWYWYAIRGCHKVKIIEISVILNPLPLIFWPLPSFLQHCDLWDWYRKYQHNRNHQHHHYHHQYIKTLPEKNVHNFVQPLLCVSSLKILGEIILVTG